MKRIDKDRLPYVVDLFSQMVRQLWYTTRARTAARWWGVQLGAQCSFWGPVRFKRYPRSRITIGENSRFRLSANRPCRIWTVKEAATIRIGAGCGFMGTFIACAKRIELGDNVRCGANTMIWDTDWHTDDPRTGPDAPVILGNNVWLGTNVTVLKGVTIGDSTFIGAGSLVTRSVPAGVIAMGVPARVIGQISAEILNALQSRSPQKGSPALGGQTSDLLCTPQLDLTDG